MGAYAARAVVTAELRHRPLPPGAGSPFASSAVALPVAGEVVARSDGPTSQGGRTVALPQGLGSVTAGRLEATVAAGTARPRIEALAGHLELLAGGLTLKVPSTGASSVVDASTAEAANGAALRDLRLGLTDVLPATLLAELPIEVLEAPAPRRRLRVPGDRRPARRSATPGTLPRTGGGGGLLALALLGVGGSSAYALHGRRRT